MQMLQAIDSLEVFDHTPGLNLFLLLDGHGSHFELEFLKNTNTVEHKWNGYIDQPPTGLCISKLEITASKCLFQDGSGKSEAAIGFAEHSGLEYTIQRRHFWFSLKGMEWQF